MGKSTVVVVFIRAFLGTPSRLSVHVGDGDGIDIRYRVLTLALVLFFGRATVVEAVTVYMFCVGSALVAVCCWCRR